MKIIFFILLFFLWQICFCQYTILIGACKTSEAGSPDIKNAGAQYFFRKYNTKQGLENSCILRVRQNKSGEILFATSGISAGIFGSKNFTFYNIC